MIPSTVGERTGLQAQAFLMGLMGESVVKYRTDGDKVVVLISVSVDDETFIGRTTLSAHASTASIFAECRTLASHVFSNCMAVGAIKSLLG